MLKHGEVSCDICDSLITKGKRYFVVRVPRDHVPSEVDIRGLSVDAEGNVRIDLCGLCRNGMGLSGEGVTA